jgi:hypothetical protein
VTFNSKPDSEHGEAQLSPPEPLDAPEPLIPLSVLALDLEPPVEGWALFLGRRGITFKPDDLGRDAISRGDAKKLLDEKREHVLRVKALRAQQEQEQVEADRQFRASLGQGVPADLIPAGSTYLEAVVAAQLDAQGYRPRRRSMAEDLFDNSGSLTFHSLAQSDEEL